jgi:hypothetical protein
MKNTLYTFLFLILITSCKKEDEIVPVIKNDIYKMNLDTTITYPTYSWNQKHHSVDVDDDGMDDISFNLNFHYFTTDFGTFVGGSSIYYCGIKSIDSSFFFAIYNDTIDSNLFEDGQEITRYADWSGSKTVYSFQHEYAASSLIIRNLENPFVLNNGYLAIKRVVGVNTYYGWARIRVEPKTSLTIYEVAFNRIANQPLKIGQK